MIKNILITGGAGFIGSHLVRYLVNNYDYNFFNLDALTYAGNLENLKDIENKKNYNFIKGNILDTELLNHIFLNNNITDVIHLSAESHVDRSISSPLDFVYTNVIGTVNLLNTAKSFWKVSKNKVNDRLNIFYNISTDEVYGSLKKEGLFTEKTPYSPNSPYSASKASSDHFVRAYQKTYNLPIIISNCSNNFGPNQFPEKLIPLIINNILEKKSLPIFGDGLYSRDWLFVQDHVKAIDLIFHKGRIGETYNIGGDNEMTNIDLVKIICSLIDEKLQNKNGESERLITFVEDRPGHDRRYAIDSSKLRSELGWHPSISFKKAISQTIDWYLSNSSWLKNITSGNYMEYYNSMYKNR